MLNLDSIKYLKVESFADVVNKIDDAGKSRSEEKESKIICSYIFKASLLDALQPNRWICERLHSKAYCSLCSRDEDAPPLSFPQAASRL